MTSAKIRLNHCHLIKARFGGRGGIKIKALKNYKLTSGVEKKKWGDGRVLEVVSIARR